MRTAILIILGLGVASLPATARAQQQPQTPPAQSQSQPQQGQPQEAQPQKQAEPQHDSLAEAARKAREQRKNISKPAKVFDNDNIARSAGTISVVGETTTKGEAAALAKEEKTDKKDEAYWRARFAKARAKLKRDQDELEVFQRELGQLQVQYYPDPQKALEQQYTRSDINNQVAKIDAKKREIQQDQQALSDLEDELRRSGGDPGWARD